MEENAEICVKITLTVGRDFLGMARTDVTAAYIISGHLKALVQSCVAGWHVKVDLAGQMLAVTRPGGGA